MSSNRLLLASSKASGTPPPTDTNFNYVAALFHGNGANAVTNNSYKSIVQPNLYKNGVSAEGSFSPYGNTSNWSTYFNGTTSLLTLSTGTGLAFSTNNFTVECWIRPTAAQGANPAFYIDARTASQTAAWYFGVSLNGSTGQLAWANNVGNVAVDPSTTDIPVNVWTHIAYARQGTTGRLFVNGTIVATVTDSNSYVAGATPTIGARYDAANYFGGNIHGMRVVNGTALYTANFTVPSAPLTAVTNTVLLTCQSYQFSDRSATAATVTSTGAVIVRANPFADGGTPYSVNTQSGSCWFDGASGYHSAYSNSNFQLTGDFTMEAWVYPQSASASGVTIFSNWAFGTASSCGFIFAIGQTGILSLNYGIGSSNVAVSTTLKVQFNQWNHIAVTRQGTSLRFFVNGVMDAAVATVSGALNNSPQAFCLGADNNRTGFTAGNFLPGFITDARIVNGTALYTANFTPNTTPLGKVTGTVLLYNAQSGGTIGLVDSAMNLNVATTGQAQFSTAQSKFGGSSMYFNGTASTQLQIPMDRMLPFSSGNFTIEFWMYNTSVASGLGIFSTRIDTAGYGPIELVWGASSVLNLYFSTTGSSWTNIAASTSPGTNTWNHVAIVRNGGTITLYVDGTSRGSAAVSGALYYNGVPMILGGQGQTYGGGGAPMQGYIQEFRITHGIARYTSNFTAPTTAYGSSISIDANFNYVSVLLHGNGQQGYANNVLVGNIPQSTLSLTANSPTLLGQSTFTPFGGTSWGTYFPTGAYLSYGASTSASPGNQTHTFECWVNLSALPASGSLHTIIQKGRIATSNFEMALYIQNTSGTYQLLYQCSTTGANTFSAASSNITLTIGKWTHIAFTQVSGSSVVKFWVNGQSAGSVSHGATGLATGTAPMGIANTGTGNNNGFQGYISNVRMVFGSQVYTSAFTPPTAPLTAIAGTNFLGCQSSLHLDNSSNAWAVTATNGPAATHFNPFGANGVPYNVAVQGGSTWFSGGGSSLTATSNACFWFGTSPFTIEAWIYPTVLNASGAGIVDTRNATTAQATVLYLNGSGQLTFFDGPNNTSYSDTVAVPLNAWTHVAVARDTAGVWRLFKNGVQVATTTALDNLGSNQPVMIGQQLNGSTYAYTGLIASIRVCANFARYTAAFTVPTGPLVADQYTSFMYSSTDVATEIYDSAMQQPSTYVGSVAISTAQQKFGTGSLSFDGSTSYLSLPGSQVPLWGSSDFTIECWAYPTSTTQSGGLFAHRTTNAVYGPMILFFNNNLIPIYYFTTTGTSWTTMTSSTALPINTWSHIAVVRTGSTIGMYLNGVGVASNSVSGSLYGTSPAQPFLIGNQATNTNSFIGYMQDFRITYGLGRYTTGFTPPTTTFPNQ